MKANEAPEKIYLLSTPNRMLDGWYRDKSPIPPSFEQVEYTRTDAFIEKACEYLMEYEFNDSPTIADRRKRVDEFRNYMKGEEV